MRPYRKLALGASLLALVISACTTGGGSSPSTSASPDAGSSAGASAPAGELPEITVGSDNFYESALVAEIYAQALEAKDVKVEKKLRIGAREAYIPALENGEIDLIPEYTGNLLLYFDKNATATESGAVDDALEDALPDKL